MIMCGYGSLTVAKIVIDLLEEFLSGYYLLLG